MHSNYCLLINSLAKERNGKIRIGILILHCSSIIQRNLTEFVTTCFDIHPIFQSVHYLYYSPFCATREESRLIKAVMNMLQMKQCDG